MSDSRFKRNLKFAAIAHFALVMVLACSSFCRSFLDRRKNIEMPIEFTVEYPRETPQREGKKPVVVPPPVQELKPKPREIPSPKTEPRMAPEPTPKPKPKPQPQPKSEPRISSPVVVRERKIEAKRPALLEEEIRRLLEKGARLSDVTRIPSDDAIYREIIRRTFYDAWLQPSKEEAGDATAEVELRLADGGLVLSHRLVNGSGNSIFDASVLEAVGRVQRIGGLSLEFLARNPVVTISFRVE